MKKVLFLYPIEEYMSDTILFSEEILKKFNRTLDKRYRQKGYEINFLMFKDKEVPFLKKAKNDKILHVDITFARHIGDEYDFVYPDNEVIYQQIKDSEELIVCGFHAMDCVKRVAEYCHQKEMNVLIDVELTDMFRNYCKRHTFDEENYNLANIIEYIKAENYFLGSIDALYSNPEIIFAKPYYQKERFTADFDFESILAKMQKDEKNKVKMK